MTLHGSDFPEIGWRCACNGHDWGYDSQFFSFSSPDPSVFNGNLVFSETGELCEKCRLIPWKLIPDFMIERRNG